MNNININNIIIILIMNYGKVFNVCKEMMVARGYTITDENINTDDEESIHIKCIDDDDKKINLYIITHNKLNIDIMKYYYGLFHKKGLKHAILVYQNNVTSSVKKILHNADIFIELFCSDELHYNILKHHLVPKHIKIDNRKKNDKKYPILKKSDPVSRFMGYKYGDIIEIHRKNGEIYYRFVR
jgi:DNA-directed RNA polymerase subunit H (RpoH/RPB5)